MKLRAIMPGHRTHRQPPHRKPCALLRADYRNCGLPTGVTDAEPLINAVCSKDGGARTLCPEQSRRWGEKMLRRLGAEFIGTFMLVSSVCGAALFSAPSAGLMTVAFAIGAAVLAMAYAVGHISGAHFNPAVTLGLVAAGRFKSADALPYIVAQVAGGIIAAAVFYVILAGAPPGKWNDFLAISNVYGGPNHFPLPQVALIEAVLTALFLMVIVGATSPSAPAGFAPIAIGLTLTFIHLVAIPVSNSSVNPARSTATALFGGPVALSCLWVFWVAPIAGGVAGGFVPRWLQEEEVAVAVIARRAAAGDD
jgi:aquaporin Z